MNIFRLATICVVQLMLLADPSLAKKSYLDCGPAYFEPRDEVVTPHICWAKPLVGGPLQVLFITNHKSTREVIELAQRLDVDFEVFTTESREVFAVKPPEYLEVGNTKPEDYERRLREKLAREKKYDVILMASINWDILPRWSRADILSRIKKGTGFVSLVNESKDAGWLKLRAESSEVSATKAFSPFPYLALPEYRSSQAGKAPDFMDKMIETYTYGKGRVLQIKGINPPMRQLITPSYAEATLDVKMLHYDYHLSFPIRFMLWASGREPSVRVRATTPWRWCHTGDSGMDRANMEPISFRIESDGQRQVQLELVIRDHDNRILVSKARQMSAKAGDNLVRFEVPALPAGTHFVDLWVKDAKGKAVIDFGTLSLEVRSKTHLGDLTLDSDNFKKEHAVSGQVLVVNPTGDEQLIVDQLDNFGRWTGTSTIPVPENSGGVETVSFSVRANDTRSIRQVVQVQLMRNGKVVDTKSKAFSISNLYAPDDVRSSLFVVENGRCYVDVLYMREVAKGGFDSVWTNPDTKRMAPLASRANLYRMPSDFGPGSATDTLKTEKGPVRYRCLTDPKVIEDIKRRATASGQHWGKFSNRDISLASEGGYMRGHDDSANACFSPSCIRDFQRWLKKEYSTLEAVNAEYDSRYTSWESIIPIAKPDAPAPGIYRKILQLPEVWKFKIDPESIGKSEKWYATDLDDSTWGPMLVGRFWKPKGYNDYDGAGWYRLRVKLPVALAEKQVKLRFGAADEAAYVYVNGVFAGAHDVGPGGWDQGFDINITDQIKAGEENLIAVLVIDTMREGGLWKPVTVLTPKSSKAIAEETEQQAQLRRSQSKLMPLWVDHRRHMETVWTSFFEVNTRAFRKVIPNARIGYQCSGSIGHGGNSYAAVDYWAMNQAMSLNCNYPGPFAPEATRDFIQPGAIIGNDCWGYSLNSWGLRWAPWRSLLRGANMFLVFRGLGHTHGGTAGNAMDMMAPDLLWYEGFRGSVEQQEEIKRGIGKLLMESKRSHDGIAVMYSASSTHVSAFTDGLPKYVDTLRAFPYLFEDAGYQYRTVSYQQVAEGILGGGEFRVLYMPYCQAVSKAEAAAIKSFVASGGTVIADLRPGVTDEHGKAYSQGILDEVFGVRQRTDNAQALRGLVRINQPIGSFRGRTIITYSDASLQVTTGKVHGQSVLPEVLREGRPGRSCPVAVVNNYGKGRAILFNFSVSDYGSEAGYSRRVQEFLQAVLSSIDVQPSITLSPNIPGSQVYRYHQGRSIYAALLRNPAGTNVPGHDNGQDDIDEFKPEEFTIGLPRESHLYDMRAGKYLGFVDQVKHTENDVTAFMLAALPYRVTGLDLQCQTTSPKQGDVVTVKARIVVEGGESAGLHVVHLEVIDPEGREVSCLSSNVVAEDGQCDFPIPFALNDLPGGWRLVVRDVASGVSVKIVLGLKQVDGALR